jgi:NAD(P)-dependent dehydrogenase (short-subunit alcohol dehydrogenase family)
VLTGGGHGLGRALTEALSARGWRVVTDGRRVAELEAWAATVAGVIAVGGDVTDPVHRELMIATAKSLGRIDLLVNNASDLGPTPLPALAELSPAAYRHVLETDVVAPLALIGLALPALRAASGTVMNLSSDAAIEAYAHWGGYGSAKAALDHLTAVLGVEEPDVRCYAVDPGDMRTAMHQAAFPGVDISDRPAAASVVPALLRLLDERPPSGRYRTAGAEVAA